MPPVKRSDKKAVVKTPCDKSEKRVNQRPGQKSNSNISYYNNVTIDQLGETFINALPGLSSSQTKTKPCPPDAKTGNKQLTACRDRVKKECESKAKETTPKRLRPSATVKLASYSTEH